MCPALEGVTEDATNPDDEDPPPLPTDSPPVSPMPDSENSRPLLDQKKKPYPEGIYLQPSEWKQDVEELKQKKRKRKSVNAAISHRLIYLMKTPLKRISQMLYKSKTTVRHKVTFFTPLKHPSIHPSTRFHSRWTGTTRVQLHSSGVVLKVNRFIF